MANLDEIFERLRTLESDYARTDQHVQDLEKYLTSFTAILSSKIDKLQKTVEIRFRWTLGIMVFVTLSLISIVVTCLVTGK